ncbi:ribosomal RNA-processing protein 8 isoform X1 [Ornithorhynchus anatinus]|uniref:Ribosomal RNA-processing protein 8 n=1 Tax=Ornithorhynchus anatinus TaxID=9258 RepID=A0A6I8N0F4_ORNAN|nr:ribosomal RNA-processing protein 8 isoform X1 [Ornithorhynchus anatinus]XP_028908408.1 ribosomal RNA-processing protein 8 isoform X1 [Ornithorhynchus anatinus]
MFAEPPWAHEARGLRDVVVPAPTHPPSSKPQKGRGQQKLLAVLQKLEAAALPRQLAPAWPCGSEGGDSDDSSGEEARGRKKKLKKRRSNPEAEAPDLHAKASPPPGTGKKRRRKQGAPAPVDEAPTPSLPAPGATGGQEPKEGEAGLQTPDRPLSRKQWRNRQKNKRRNKNKFQPSGKQPPPTDAASASGPAPETPPAPEEPGAEARSRADALRARMEERLEGARFRCLNEQLYTGPSSAARRLFRDDPDAFQIYHRGFQAQLRHWPLRPVEAIIRNLRRRPASLVVADFGCGDCQLASGIRNPVHCFDLAALDPRVVVCDMAKVPLEDASVDVAVFCLSLMGTNLRDFLEEANRVLKPGGLLKVAEVASRFEDVRAFLGALAQLGFKNISKDLSNSHFYLFDFRKTGPPQAKGRLPGLALRPCVYKRR